MSVESGNELGYHEESKGGAVETYDGRKGHRPRFETTVLKPIPDQHASYRHTIQIIIITKTLLDVIMTLSIFSTIYLTQKDEHLW